MNGSTSEREYKRERQRTWQHLEPSFSLSVGTDRSGAEREGVKRSLVRLDGRKYLRGGGSQRK